MLRRRFFIRSLLKRGTSNQKNLKSNRNEAVSVDEGKLKKRKKALKNRVRKKRRVGGNDGVDDRNACIDRISELPEPIIHHIFSFMKSGKDVVRTSILSKRWKSVRDSYPLFDFDERWFRVQPGKGRHNRIKAREIQRKKFKSYVGKSLASNLDSVPSIDRFRLHVNNNTDLMIDLMQHWVRSVMKKNVKELDIHIDAKTKNCIFSSNVFVSSTTTSLKCSGLFGLPKMSNLRELSIKDTTLLNGFLFNLFEEECPLIEDLRLVRCNGLLHLSISALLKLRRVEVHECTKLNFIDIEAGNLETFCYYAGRTQDCKINLKGSGNLKNMTFRAWRMLETEFQDCISKCPMLEKLVLQELNSLEKLTILSRKLKKLVIVNCVQLHETNIDAPNLYSFEYSGHRIPFSSMNVLGLCAAKFSFGPSMKTFQCIVDYAKLFGNFDQSKNFKLIIYSKQNMKIYEEPREARLIPHFFRKLELTLSLTSVVKIVDNWLRENHGKSLVLVSPSSELAKRLNSLIVGRENSPNCCGTYSNKCWRHYLANLKTTSNKTHKTCYEFKWRSRKELSA